MWLGPRQKSPALMFPVTRQPNVAWLVTLSCVGEKDLSQMAHAAEVGVKVKKEVEL